MSPAFWITLIPNLIKSMKMNSATLSYVLRAILDVEPDMVMALEPRGITGNPDHLAITRATTEAISPMPIDKNLISFIGALLNPPPNVSKRYQTYHLSA